MARNANQVTLTFAGDSTDLERSMDRVGQGSRDMGTEASSGFDRVGQSADNLDSRAMGFRDTLTGVEDTGKGVANLMKGNMLEGALELGMGVGDLASGVANFGVQMAKTTGRFIAQQARMLAAHMANAARMAVGWLIAMGPIALVIAAVAGIIAILVALGVDFDTIKEIAVNAWEMIWGGIKKVWNWISENWPLLLAILVGPFGLAVKWVIDNWDKISNKAGEVFDWIKNRAAGAKDWIVGRFEDVVDFFTGLPGRIRGVFSGFGSSVVDGISSAWNNTIGGFGFDVPGWVPGAGGRSFSIPELAEGGIVNGPTLAMIGERGPEAVVPLDRMGGGGSQRLVVDVEGADEEMARLIRKLLRTSRLEIG